MRRDWYVWALLAVLFLIGIGIGLALATVCHAGSVTLGWSEATPLSDLSGFRLYQGTTSGSYDTVTPVGPVTSATLANLTDGLTYYFAATAVGLSGLESGFSNEVSTVVVPPPPPDTTPPVVSITSPTDGAIVPRHTTIRVSAQASDNVGVDHVNLYVNGSLLCSRGTAPYDCSWNVPAANNGRSYQLQAKAYDAAGNVGSATITVRAQ